MRKGYVTVFFAISMALLLSFFMTLLNGLIRGGSRLKSECAIDTALISEFAEYNPIVWKKYGLIFVDSAYGKSKGGIKGPKDHLKSCMNENFDERYLTLFGGVDLYGLRASKCDIQGIRFATDNDGLAIIEQVKKLMEYKLGSGYLKEILSFAGKVDQYDIDPTEYISKAEHDNEILTRDYDIHDYQGWINTVDVGVTDSGKDSISYFSILRKIIANTDSISKEYINEESFISNRQINTGNLSTDYKVSEIDKLLFKQYLFDFLSSYLFYREGSKLSYQSEYLIFGKSSDIQNLELSAKRIMFIRLAADILSLLSDHERMEKIEGIGKIIGVLLGAPEIEGLITTVIVAGWSYLEAVADTKVLFSGKKVPFMKGHDEWITGLSGIFSGKDSYDDMEGMSYRDYIRVFIFLSKQQTLMERFMNLIESDVRKESGYEAFRLDNCFDYIEAEVEVTSKRGFSFEMKRRRGISHD